MLAGGPVAAAIKDKSRWYQALLDLGRNHELADVIAPDSAMLEEGLRQSLDPRPMLLHQSSRSRR
jgi:hypothetical protein